MNTYASRASVVCVRALRETHTRDDPDWSDSSTLISTSCKGILCDQAKNFRLTDSIQTHDLITRSRARRATIAGKPETLAGSVATMPECVRNLAKIVGVPAALTAATAHPANGEIPSIGSDKTPNQPYPETIQRHRDRNKRHVSTLFLPSCNESVTS